MNLELSPYSIATLKLNNKFFSGNPIEYCSKDKVRRNKEKLLLKSTFKEALKRNTKLYRVRDKTQKNAGNLGFFAISVGNINVNGNKIPSAILDYFILDDKFRKSNIKSSEYILAVDLFQEILAIISHTSDTIGIRYIILEPLAKEQYLVDFYKKFGFDFIPNKNTSWMYLDIKELC